MRKKIFTLNEVIRFFGYVFLATTFIPSANCQFDVTPFEANPNDEIKEPYDSLANYTDYDLNSDYDDLESMYNQMQHLYYNSTGNASNIRQIYPAVNQQNYSDWFSQLLNNSYDDSSVTPFNFSNMFSDTTSSSNRYHPLSNSFKVFPGNKNVTVFNTTLPSMINTTDANIFDNALNSSAPSLDNGSAIYVNLPEIHSLSLNKTTNSSDMLKNFFHKLPIVPNTIPKPTRPTPTTPQDSDLLAKKVGEDVAQNSSTYLQNMLSKLGLQNISMNSNPKTPLNLHRLNMSDVVQSPNNTTPIPNIFANQSAEGGDQVTNLTITPMVPANSTAFPYVAPLNQTIYRINPATNMTDIVTGPLNISDPINQTVTSGATTRTITTPENTSSGVTNSAMDQTDSTTSASGASTTPENTSSGVTNSAMDQTNITASASGATTTPENTSSGVTNSAMDQTNITASASGASGTENLPIDQASTTAPVNVSFPMNATDSLSDQYGEIIYSSVFFTPGFFTPPSIYPSDPYNSTEYWPEGLQQLTNIGKNQMYDLGRWLQQRYHQLIGPTYNVSLVTIDSGDTDIILSSAESLASGLFVPSGKQIWNLLIRWQPIPIHTIPAEMDNTILMDKPCEQYTLQTNTLGESSDWQQYYDNNSAVFQLIGNNTGYNFSRDDILGDLKQLMFYYQEFRIEQQRGLALPNWTNTVYPDPITSMVEKYFEFAVHTRELQKIKTGPFFETLIDRMSKKIDEANSTTPFLENLHLYAGNESGLSFIMKALGVYNSIIPPDASALIFDLRYKNNTYVITVSYKNSSADTPYVLTIPDCQPICSFNKFVNMTDDLMSDNWDDDCATITISDLTYTIPIVIFGVVIIFILALVVVLLCIKCCKCIRGKKATFS